ncbi:hypothetical protein AAU61_19220 [Desulfocarbo indianensis]|nr:hypothetical protein AAU61_19220 [Desulfocarbo indianensis]
MPQTRLFSIAELSQVARAMEVAEESVSDHFHISDTSWLRYPYELRTLAELGPAEINGKALAQVLRMRKPPRPGRLRAQDFYRICLQDHNFLRLIKRESAGELMLPLLIYVLAHELVHVVRFYRFQHLFEAEPHERAREEATVHAITAQTLRKVRLPHLDRVLDFYEEHGEDGFAAATC